MEWIDISTKRKGRVVQCRLEGPSSIPCSADGTVYHEIDLYSGESIARTTTWLAEKLARVGGSVTLVHPDTREEYEWIVVTRGRPQWVNDRGQILWGEHT
jgi:hypothetical protein